MSWYWRMKPRSIVKTIQWFPYFGKLEGQNWNETSDSLSRFQQKKVYPTRRSYIYYAHGEEDSQLSDLSYDEYILGEKDQKETESNGRNDKSTFEFFGFGYVKKDGTICVTEAGHQILKGTFNQEDYLKQLLKLQLPNYVQKIKGYDQTCGVFPMELVLQAFSKHESLNRSELALLFGCMDKNDIPKMNEAISDFKTQYQLLDNRQDTKKIKALFQRIYEQYYGKLENQVNSYYDYAEAFSRSLVYTGLFETSGRSIATKLRVAKHAGKKVALLLEKHDFCYPDNFSDLDTYMNWYGSISNIILPWENITERKEIVQDKISILQQLLSETGDTYQQSAFVTQEELDNLFLSTKSANSVHTIKHIEEKISNAIVHHNEDYFIRCSSKEPKIRQGILQKFYDILNNDDMSALWLEVNTWKSLVALQGQHIVKRNFKVEDDLSPRSFAPGVGNTPDMELYYTDTILLPEVSLMTGVRQWEHEASSVVDHMMHFMKKYPDKNVMGMFLSSKIHLRTLWQFFILNKESWIGSRLQLVPLTIDTYIKLIEHCYIKGYTIEVLLNLLKEISKEALTAKDYTSWETCIHEKISTFVQQ